MIFAVGKPGEAVRIFVGCMDPVEAARQEGAGEVVVFMPGLIVAPAVQMMIAADGESVTDLPA